MKKIIKTVDILLSVICLVVFSLVCVGDYYKPKSIVFYDDQMAVDYMKVFHVTKSNDIMTVAMNEGATAEVTADVSLLGVIPVTKIHAVEADRKYVSVGGNIVGIRLYTDGLLVVGLDKVATEHGTVSPGADCGIQIGDIITQVNDEIVTSVSSFAAAVTAANGNNISITVKRGENVLYYSLKPVYSETEGKYRCGLWLRDSTAGIGTLTFTDPSTKIFASLGHAICDSETQSVLPVGNGDILGATVYGCTIGTKGATGQIKGNFTNEIMGKIIENNEFGVYGTYSDSDIVSGELYPVASQTEIETGEAQIISTISDVGSQVYDIEIEKITYSSEKASRSMVIKITDEDLISETGGIIQGMSGSPIIQNGMLVGAVTHVFLNDPERGYAIFAETMLETADNIKANN